MKHDTGGPAKDMTLLDWFAGQAVAMVSSAMPNHSIAFQAYGIAEALIAEKRRRESAPPSGPTTTSNGQGGGE